MNKSESVTKLAPALLRAQKKIGSAIKDASNPFFKSEYATLSSVMDACKEHLNNEGILILQPVGSDEKGEFVETTLLHESGEFISSQMRLLTTTTMQAYGSAVSYARRYGLQSMVFIPAADDDGEATMGRKNSTTNTTQTTTTSVVGSTSETTTVSPSQTDNGGTKKRSTFRKPKAVAETPTTDNGGWE